MEKLKYGSRCDECEKMKYDPLICMECVETFCKDCDRKVHNKGTRVRHRRYRSQKVFYEDNKQYPRFRILYFSPECYRAVVINSKASEASRKIAEKTFEIVSRNTRQGHPMTYFEDLLPLLTVKFKLPHERVESILDAILKNEKLFTFTTRQFGNSKVEKYLSLSLSSISVEALSWILLSIKNDKMQPSQNLIHSRIKEYFDIKIGQKEWKKFIENLSPKLIAKMNNFNHEIEEIRMKKVSEELVLFYFREEGEWEYEDFSPVSEEDQDYQQFLEYIDDFFSESNSESILKETSITKSVSKSKGSHPRGKHHRFSDSNKKYTQVKPKPKMQSHSELKTQNKGKEIEENIYSPYRKNLKYKKEDSKEEETKDKSIGSANSESEIRMWLRSMDRPLDNSKSVSSQNEINAEKQLLSRGHFRAIPGGKYGCALMIKRCGPEALRKKSLGRILALIKKSLEQGVLNHYKTLLVKNKNKSNIDSFIREQQIYEYSLNVIELLKEHRGGISLAQFKQYYNRKFPKKSVDLEDLQFAKLTDFLKTMKDFVVIEKRDRNNNVASFRKDKNFRQALAHYSHLLRRINSQKKYKNGPREEYGHIKEVIQKRKLEGRKTMVSETNIYKSKQGESDPYGLGNNPRNFEISKTFFFYLQNQ